MKQALCSFVLFFTSATYSQTLEPSCPSPVYCYGDLLNTVQLAQLYNDSKTFVDMKMKQPEKQTLANFATLKASHNDTPLTREDIQKFVEENFEAGNELDKWTPTDYNPNPAFLSKILYPAVKNFASTLVKIWPDLGTIIKKEVQENPDLYSLIPVPNAFIIPGGRFREYYYWDSYWIIQGLLISDMNQTARGMIDNFLHLVDKFGFVPNGGRVYYLKRSQPPLLTSMAYAYYEKTKDKKWLAKNIETLEKELKYWLKNQMVKVKGHSLAQYNAVSSGPRPESYIEDVQTAAYFKNESQRQQVYIDLKSGAETGWDYSSRWLFDEQGGNVANLSHIQTRRVVPVDLNSYLCRAFKEISELFFAVNKPLSSISWLNKHLEFRRSIQSVFWNKKDKIYYDYDLELRRHREHFYPSNVAPLWAKCFSPFDGDRLGRNVLAYLNKNGILDYLGGIPTSIERTGQQWDLPNAWPPLQDIVAEGLVNTGNEEAKKAATVLANRWIYSNILGYEKTGNMFEKYDAEVPGQTGGGGEYPPQSGFGWTNGVALKFISEYFST